MKTKISILVLIFISYLFLLPKTFSYLYVAEASATSISIPTQTESGGGGFSGGDNGGGGANFGDNLDPLKGPSSKTFDALNPLKIGGNQDMTKTEASAYAQELSTPGGIISRLIKFLFPLAGLVLFVMLVWGGLEIMLGAVSKKVDAGKQRVTAAIVGFLLLFSSYWIWQILQVVFGVKIL